MSSCKMDLFKTIREVDEVHAEIADGCIVTLRHKGLVSVGLGFFTLKGSSVF